MKKLFLLISLFFFFSYSSYSQFRSQIIIHNEQKAAKTANEFAKDAFVEKDYQKAYLLLSKQTKEKITFEKFKEIILIMHPFSFPTIVVATDFEPIFGQKAMHIYLQGNNTNEKFYYRFYMVGTMPKGYKVGGFFRGNRQYPSNQLRKPLK